MPFLTRLRRPGTRKAGMAALTVALAVFAAACDNHPDSIFHQRTDFNRDIDYLFKLLIYAGTAVFIFVEAILIFTLIKYRKRPGQPEPEHVHGNTTLEIAWTVIPLLILIVIGIPTVRTIFKTQAVARSDALQVEVIGHQWWWEFRYPQYTTAGMNGKTDTVVTANELYLPIGKTVNFTLKTKDVLHSFWIPALAGKRDLIANHTNYLWFTPDSATSDAFNGACAEYCGTSHANMRFKAFTVAQADFDSWIANQKLTAVGATPTPTAGATVSGTTPGSAATPANAAEKAANGRPGQATIAQGANGQQTTVAPGTPGNVPMGAKNDPSRNLPAQQTLAGATIPGEGASGVGVPATAANAVNTNVQQAGFVAFPRDRMGPHVIPQTHLPGGLHFDDAILAAGNAASGAKLVQNGMCIACHTMRGIPTMQGLIGPNLTHVGSRTTIAAGLYPNDPRHLARWVKNANAMKPGVLMPSFGNGEYDPVTLKGPVKSGGFSDQQIADIVAYLSSLK